MATKIVCCKFNHCYQDMLLDCSYKFAIIKDTPGIVESEINPTDMEFVQNFTPPDFQAKNFTRQFHLFVL